MSAEIRTLSGGKVSPADESENAVVALEALLGKMKAGEIKPEAWVFVCEEESMKGYTRLLSRDSGLTVAQMIYYLERAKFDLFEASSR